MFVNAQVMFLLIKIHKFKSKMSKTIKTDASLMQMNSKRSLLELEMIKEDKNNAFESNVIFSENTEANDHS